MDLVWHCHVGICHEYSSSNVSLDQNDLKPFCLDAWTYLEIYVEKCTYLDGTSESFDSEIDHDYQKISCMSEIASVLPYDHGYSRYHPCSNCQICEVVPPSVYL